MVSIKNREVILWKRLIVCNKILSYFKYKELKQAKIGKEEWQCLLKHKHP
jgi:hypothetical protein